MADEDRIYALRVSGATDERRLLGLIEAGRGIVSELETEAVLDRVLQVARDLTGARYAALGVLDDERRNLERFITVGIDGETRARIGNLPRGRGVLGLLIDDPRPIRIADVGSHPSSYGFPAGHPPMKTFLGVPITIRGQAYGNLYLTEKEAGEFDAADEETAVILADWAAVAIENARLFQDAERRRQELERAVQELEAMTAITLALGGETELDRVLELIVKRGRALVSARAMIILLDEGGELAITAVAGDVPPDIDGVHIPIAQSVAGEVMKSRRPQRLSDMTTRLRFRLAEFGVKARTGLIVPLVFRGRALGVLEAFDHIGGTQEFGPEAERLMMSFAASAATAVATAQAVAADRARQSINASERERGRWARELHDETLQGLGALRLLLASGLRHGSEGTLEESVRTAIAQLELEISGLRRLIAELRPAALDELGLEAAVQGLVERTTTVSGLEVELDLTMPDHEAEDGTAFGWEIDNTLYRIIQEALTNVAKHARAEHVTIVLAPRREVIEVEIVDDGVGFAPDGVHGGFGLRGMRERVEMSDGTMTLASAPGEGTRVRVTIPNGTESQLRRSA